MEQEILKLVYDYSKNGKLADRDFILKLITIVVEHKTLNSYIRRLKMCNKPTNEENELHLAEYSMCEKEIVVNLTGLDNYLKICYGKYSEMFNNIEKLFYGNLIVSQVILHELEHADQNKKFDSNDMDTETRLIKISLREVKLLKDPEALFDVYIKMGLTPQEVICYFQRKKQLYKEYYDYNPIERLAQIRAYKTITDSICSLKDRLPNLYELEYASYIKNLLAGYEYDSNGLVAPTVRYMTGMNYTDSWKSFDFYDSDPTEMMKNLSKDYNLISRFTFGLPVTVCEHDQAQKVLNYTNKF